MERTRDRLLDLAAFREVRKMMFWSTVTVIVAALIIIAFLVPLFAAILFGEEIARHFAEARREKTARAVSRKRSPLEASGPVCPWEPGMAHEEEMKRAS